MNRILPVLRTGRGWGRPSLDLFDQMDKWFEDVNTPALFQENRAWAPTLDVSENENELSAVDA